MKHTLGFWWLKLAYFLCNLNKVVWEQDNMSSTIRFPSNQIEKRVARYVNFTHFARRTICQKRLLFNAWYYHHQHQPFAKSKSWEIFPKIQSQHSSLWTWCKGLTVCISDNFLYFSDSLPNNCIASLLEIDQHWNNPWESPLIRKVCVFVQVQWR